LPNDGEVVFAENVVVDGDLSSEIEMNDLYLLMCQLQRRLKQIYLTKEEFVVMKAIALVNSGEKASGDASKFISY